MEKNKVEVGGVTISADDVLAKLGYESELIRTRSTWQVAFMSFVLAAVPYGLSTTLVYPVVGGGPVAIIWGLVIVCAIMLCLALSLGEITSVYPTAGGVYYQTFMLSSAKYRRVAAWVCGWAYALGNITITLSVNFGTTLFLIGCINIFTDADGNPIYQPATYQIWLIVVGFTLLSNAVSAFGNRWLPLLDTMAMYATFAAVIAIGISVLAVANQGRHHAKYVFTAFEASSGWPDGWSFCIGLLHAAYATSATGMVISMCEEVKHPATQVPKALVGALGLNFLCGVMFLVPLVFVLPPVADILASTTGQPLPVILTAAIGNQGGAFALTIPIWVLGIICGVGCTTAASRCVWAFARDGGIPGSKWWKRVDPKLDVPLNAMALSMVAQILLGLIYFGSVAAFNAVFNVGIIFLTLSYVIPIAASMLDRRRKIRGGIYNFGVVGIGCNVVSIAWALFIIPVACMPSAIPITANTMNYAAVVFVGGVVIAAVWYVLWGHTNYQGPPVKEEDIRDNE